MKFVKKLFVLTGHGGKGAVTVESNAFGTFAQVGIGLRSARGRRYFVFVSNRTKVFPLSGGDKFDLGDASVSPAHLAVVAVSGKDMEVELYGTDSEKRMWQSNLLDLVRGKINDFETAAGLEKNTAKDALETPTEKGLSLFPTTGGYDDGAIARVNYYSNIYSSREKTPSELLGEQARLEELAGRLMSARSVVEEPKTEEVKVKEREIEEREIEEPKADKSERTETETEGAGEEAAAAVAAADSLSRYARYLYSYRDELLQKKNGGINTASVKSGEDAPRAPKADLVKSEIKLKEVTPKKLNFYERMKGKIDRLFEEGVKEPVLERLLPSSRFVRIEVEDSDKYYCVGLVGSPDYICYAVPAFFTPQPPEELDGYCQWLPVDETKPEGSGFWVIYQDAVSGESVDFKH